MAEADGRVAPKGFVLDYWTPEQKAALQNANMERSARGLPSWLHIDFILAHPRKFEAQVNYDLHKPEDLAEAQARAVQAAKPAEPPRADQR